jgi:hypothetical protein
VILAFATEGLRGGKCTTPLAIGVATPKGHAEPVSGRRHRRPHDPSEVEDEPYQQPLDQGRSGQAALLLVDLDVAAFELVIAGVVAVLQDDPIGVFRPGLSLIRDMDPVGERT